MERRTVDEFEFMLSPYLHRGRNVVERFLDRLKQCRRVATRYDKLAARPNIEEASNRMNERWKLYLGFLDGLDKMS